MTNSDYQARNALGTIIRSFGDEKTAKDWVKANAKFHNGLHAVRVTTTVTVHRIYTPREGRAELRVVA